MGFCSQRVTTMIQFSSVISMVAPHGAMEQMRQPCLGWMRTDRTFEFTTLVICLCNVQQLALLFFTFLRCPAAPAVRLRTFGTCTSAQVKLRWTNTFFWQWQNDSPCWTITFQAEATCFQMWTSFFLWFLGEVKHFVYLIHLNLNSCLLPMWLDRQRSRFREQRTNF